MTCWVTVLLHSLLSLKKPPMVESELDFLLTRSYPGILLVALAVEAIVINSETSTRRRLAFFKLCHKLLKLPYRTAKEIRHWQNHQLNLPVRICNGHGRRNGRVHGRVVETLQSGWWGSGTGLFCRRGCSSSLISQLLFPPPLSSSVRKPHLYPSFWQTDFRRQPFPGEHVRVVGSLKF